MSLQAARVVICLFPSIHQNHVAPSGAAKDFIQHIYLYVLAFLKISKQALMLNGVSL